MHTQRAIRRFTDVPVSDEAIQRILEAAVRAPSGRNTQPWRFVVIRDVETKQKIGDYYRRACEEAGIGQEPIPGLSRKVNESVAHLALHMGDAPVLILVCYEYVDGGGRRGEHPPDRIVDLSRRAEPAAGGALARTGHRADDCPLDVRETRSRPCSAFPRTCRRRR